MYSTKLHKKFIDLSRPIKPIPTGEKPKLKKLSNIRVLAYDFYGTLFISGVGDIGVDDGSFDADVLNQVFENSGITVKHPDTGSMAIKAYNHVAEEAMQKAKDEGIEFPEPDIRSIWQSVLSLLKDKNLIHYSESSSLYEMLSIEFETKMNPVWPMPGVTKILHHFKENGMAQGIISNSQFYTPVVLEALTGYSLQDLGFSEELLHWSYEEKMKKPGLQFYNSFVKKLHLVDETLKPGHVLYIGNDMLKDVYPAHTIGMKTALFAGDERSLKWRKEDDRCKNIDPDLVITEWWQLAECIEA